MTSLQGISEKQEACMTKQITLRKQQTDRLYHEFPQTWDHKNDAKRCLI